MLRLLPSHKHFRGKDLRVTDPTELGFAESKLIHLAQMEFVGPAGIIRSTGRIVRLVNTEFDTKHPILIDARHTLVRLLASS